MVVNDPYEANSDFYDHIDSFRLGFTFTPSLKADNVPLLLEYTTSGSGDWKTYGADLRTGSDLKIAVQTEGSKSYVGQAGYNDVLDIPQGERFTGWRLSLGGDNAAIHSGAQVTVNSEFIASYPSLLDGSAPPAEPLANTATVDGTLESGDSIESKSSEAKMTIVDRVPIVTEVKAPEFIEVGKSATYQAGIANLDPSGRSYEDSVMKVVLPVGVLYDPSVGVSPKYESTPTSGIPLPTVGNGLEVSTETITIDGQEHQVVVFNFDELDSTRTAGNPKDRWEMNDGFWYDIPVQVLPQAYDAEATQVPVESWAYTNDEVYSKITMGYYGGYYTQDKHDFSASLNTIAGRTDPSRVIIAGGVLIGKTTRASSEDPWALNAEVKSPGTAQWQIYVTNTLPSQIDNFVLFDRLPFVGDDRNSQFDVVLAGEGVSDPGEVVLEYSKDATSATDGSWSSDPEGATAVRASLNVLPSGAAVTLTFETKVPAGVDAGSIATNDVHASGLYNGSERNFGSNEATVTIAPDPLGEVVWTKVDPEGQALAGSEWELIGPDGESVVVVDNGTNDADEAEGSLKVVDLPLGEYTLKETKAPEGFDLVEGTLTVTLTEDELSVSFGAVENTPTPDPLGEVVWTKVDPEGQALAGSEWELIGPDGESVVVVDNGTNDADEAEGSLKVVDLPLGEYTLKETKAPEGFDLVEGTLTVTLTEDELSVSFGAVENTPTPDPLGEVVWTKVDPEGQALAGSEWELIGPDGESVVVVDNGTNDADEAEGSLKVVDLPLGEYTLKETKAPEGFDLVEGTLTVTLTEDELSVSFGAVENTPTPDPLGEVVWTKVDPEGQALAGSEWELIGPDGESVVVVDNGTNDADEAEGSLKVVDLPLGEYTLKETKAPEGFDLVEGTLTVTLTEDELSVSFGAVENTPTPDPLGEVVWTKVDPEGQALAGSEWELIGPDGESVVVVDNGTNDADEAEGSLKVVDLPLGEYTLKETKAPEGFDLVEGTLTVTLTEDELSVSFGAVENTPTPDPLGEVVWTKVDPEGQALAGSEWELIGPDGESVVVVDNGTNDADEAEGSLKVVDLPLGEYTLKETKAPEGFDLVEGTLTVTLTEDELSVSFGAVENTPTPLEPSPTPTEPTPTEPTPTEPTPTEPTPTEPTPTEPTPTEPTPTEPTPTEPTPTEPTPTEPTPTEPTPTESTPTEPTPTEPSSSSPNKDKDGSNLADTGFTALSVLFLGLLLIGTGVGAVFARRAKKH